jgi:hypothetical protein
VGGGRVNHLLAKPLTLYLEWGRQRARQMSIETERPF